jgi:glycosyltransferase involved in cell wall biosynthesis
VFDLSPDRRTKPLGDPLILGAIGTLEPRKNFLAAAKISQALQAKLGRPVELHIIGRDGWGGEWQRLAREPGVSLHGFLADDKARRTIQTFDALICTSYAEGLCLPLLEAQYAGLPVIAPDQPVFREVLDRSGLFIDPANTRAAADLLYAVFESRKSSSHESALATANIARWNTLAAQDREHAIAFLTRISAEVMAA